MYARNALNTYAKTNLESSVIGADSHKLISMLFQGALLAIANAKNSILRKDVANKGKAITQAMLIINEGLQASLDKKVGGELAMNLDALYGYMCVRLAHANLHSDIDALSEVARLLGELKEAWDSIRQTATNPQSQIAQQTPPVQANKQPALVYGRM